MPATNFPKPDRLYKYTSIDSANLILSTKTLKFSKPRDFNDPFDCDVSLLDFEIKGNINEHVAIEIEKIKKQFSDRAEFHNLSSQKGFWEELYRRSQISKVESSRICCFSLSNDVVLMWSHYSNKHTGVCLEFDNKIQNRFLGLNEEADISEGVVGYAAHERINYMEEDRLIGTYKLFFNKSESWSHENEYRLVLLNNKAEYQEFLPDFIKAIYFGVNTSEEDIKKLISVCRNSNLYNLSFIKCIKDNLKIKFSKIT